MKHQGYIILCESSSITELYGSVVEDSPQSSTVKAIFPHV